MLAYSSDIKYTILIMQNQHYSSIFKMFSLDCLNTQKRIQQNIIINLCEHKNTICSEYLQATEPRTESKK